MLSLHIRRLGQGPSEHEFPGEMSAFVLKKSQIQGLAGTIDAANSTLRPNQIRHRLPVGVGIHKIRHEIDLRISKMLHFGFERLAMIEDIVGSQFFTQSQSPDAKP
jgi:hypothetical protein